MAKLKPKKRLAYAFSDEKLRFKGQLSRSDSALHKVIMLSRCKNRIAPHCCVYCYREFTTGNPAELCSISWDCDLVSPQPDVPFLFFYEARHARNHNVRSQMYLLCPFTKQDMQEITMIAKKVNYRATKLWEIYETLCSLPSYLSILHTALPL